MNGLRVGQVLDPDAAFAAFAVFEAFESVMVGDVDGRRRQVRRIESMGVDRMIGLVRFVTLDHEAVMISLRTTGKFLAPEFQGRDGFVCSSSVFDVRGALSLQGGRARACRNRLREGQGCSTGQL